MPSLALISKSGMNAAFGDVFNDGRLAVYKTNISEPGVLVQANDLWVPGKSAAAASGRDGGPPSGAAEDGVVPFENLASSLGEQEVLVIGSRFP